MQQRLECASRIKISRLFPEHYVRHKAGARGDVLAEQLVLIGK